MQRKPIFDFVRNLLGRGFRRAEIEALDSAIDAAIGTAVGPNRCHGRPMQVSEAGIALIKRFEGCARVRPDGLVESYPDPATGGEPWTIGWGATGPDIKPRTVWTQAACDARLSVDVARHAKDVLAALQGAPVTQSQFDALVSFHFNTGAIFRATLTRMHVAGDFEGAAAQFSRWNRGGGKVMRGLVRRRSAEAGLYRA